MCLESKYLIGFKIPHAGVRMCVCEMSGGLVTDHFSCREEEHRDQSANWEISTFTIYTYLQFTMFTIFPLPGPPSDAQSGRRAGRGCTVRQLQSAWGHRDKHSISRNLRFTQFVHLSTFILYE